MATSSSSAVPSKGNVRSRAVNWQASVSQMDSPRISDEFSPPIEDRHLLSLARILAVVENDIVQSVKLIYTEFGEQRPQKSAEEEARVRRSLAEMEVIIAQFNDINEGRRRLGAAYLKERRLLFYWRQYYYLMNQLLDGYSRSADQTAYVKTVSALKTHKKSASRLPDAIETAAAHGCLNDDEELLLEERWVKLDEMAEAYRSKIPELGTLPTWKEIGDRIVRVRGSKGQKRTNTTLQSQSVLLWLVFLTTVSNTSTFGLAYYYSSHTPGTTQDADFWLLVQQAATQSVGLIITCIPLTMKVDLPRLPWLLPAIAVLGLTVASIPLYLYMPTEWSSFCMLVGGAIQTFLILQLAILGA